MKYTAWPALAVLVVMIKARDGGRAAVRFGAVALGTAAVLTAALAPAALPDPDALLRNTVAYPLGLTGVTSPAQSPLPGHLLTTLGPAGHATAIALLILAGVALVLSLVFAAPAARPGRPPGSPSGSPRCSPCRRRRGSATFATRSRSAAGSPSPEPGASPSAGQRHA